MNMVARPSQRSGLSEASSDRMRYVQAMLRELCQMSQAERCSSAAYYIEMAYLEVSDLLRGEVTPDGRTTPSDGFSCPIPARG